MTSNDMEKMLKELQDFLQKRGITSIKGIPISVLNELQIFFIKYGATMIEAISALNSTLKESADTLANAWNYTEITTKANETYSFKEALAWIKKYNDPTIHSAASITREKEGQHIVLYACFLDKNKNPLTKPGDPFLKVITNEICQDFKDNFGDKNMFLVQ